MIVAGGWVLLLAAPQLNDAAAHFSGRPLEAATSTNVASIAQCAILSGFGVGIIGALQTGFGALEPLFCGGARAVRASAGATCGAVRSLSGGAIYKRPSRATAAAQGQRPPRPRPSAGDSPRRQEKSWSADGLRTGPMFFSSTAASRLKRCWGGASSPRFRKRRIDRVRRLGGPARRRHHRRDGYRKRFGHAEFA